MFDVVFQLDSPNIGRFKQIGGYIYIPGWWFGTFFIFHNIWHNPSH
jgi:hypothetical protein